MRASLSWAKHLPKVTLFNTTTLVSTYKFWGNINIRIITYTCKILSLIVWEWVWKEGWFYFSDKIWAPWEKNLSQVQFSFWSPVLFGKVSRHMSTQVHFFSILNEFLVLQVVKRFHSSLLRHHLPRCLWHYPQWTWKTALSLWASALSRRTRNPQEQIPSECEVRASTILVLLALRSFSLGINPSLRLFWSFSIFWKTILNFVLKWKV